MRKNCLELQGNTTCLFSVKGKLTKDTRIAGRIVWKVSGRIWCAFCRSPKTLQRLAGNNNGRVQANCRGYTTASGSAAGALCGMSPQGIILCGEAGCEGKKGGILR
ncbi:MAG: hypothetical protein V8S08_04090 [Lachnoclostridium sp.]